MKKKIIIAIILFAISGYLIYWFYNPIKNIDFSEKYQDYFDHALGEDWKVEAVEHYKIIKKYKLYAYDAWTISYKDEAGTRQLLKISNYETVLYNDREKASDYVFAKEILHSYVDMLEKDIIKESKLNLISTLNLIDAAEYNKAFYKGSLDIINPETGLSFKALTFEQLVDDSYYMELNVLFDPAEDDENDYKQYTIDCAKKIIEEYKLKNAIISEGEIKKDDGITTPIYCLKQEKEEACPLDNDLDTMNDYFLDSNNYIEIN